MKAPKIRTMKGRLAVAIRHAANSAVTDSEDYCSFPMAFAAADAALRELRVPTDAMIAKAVRDEGADEEWANIHWQAMIDAALAEE